MKPILKSKKNLELIKSFSCFVCGDYPTDPDHIKTRGSGGDDSLSNINALCRRCHCDRHSMGIKTFIERFRPRLEASRDKYDLPPMNLVFITD